jgi:hypothetical protein
LCAPIIQAQISQLFDRKADPLGNEVVALLELLQQCPVEEKAARMQKLELSRGQ